MTEVLIVVLSDGNVGIRLYLEKNIVISQYAMHCLERLSEEMAVGDYAPDPQMRKQGNLFFVDVDDRDMKATDARPSPTTPSRCRQRSRHLPSPATGGLGVSPNAVGRHLAETIVGRPHNLDLSRLGAGRIAARDGLLEHAGRIIRP